MISPIGGSSIGENLDILQFGSLLLESSVIDRILFTPQSPGDLVKVTLLSRSDAAFVPHPLPPEWSFDQRLWPLIAEARAAIGVLNGIGKTLPDANLMIQPLVTQEAVQSSMIEGTVVSPENLLLYEFDPIEPDSDAGELADWYEVFNYRRAMDGGCAAVRAGRPLSGQLLREMHQTLRKGVRGRDKSPGQFRVRQNQIGSNARYVPPPPLQVDPLMENLEAYINTPASGVDPLVQCFIAHYQFEAIHPFEDGNGRVGRLLLSLMMYQLLKLDQPWVYLSAYFERFREEYVSHMFCVSTKGDWSAWIEYCLRATIAQAGDAMRRCEDLLALRREYLELSIAHSPRTHRLIEGLFARQFVQIAPVAEEFKVSYKTAQRDIELLVQAGILTELSHPRPKTYSASRIMQIAFRPLE